MSQLNKEEEPSNALKDFLLPYRDEAAVIHVPLCGEKRHLALQEIMVYNVIEKRRYELIDLAAGMNELSLIDYLKKHTQLSTVLFPREAESVIDKEDLKSRFVLQDKTHPHGTRILGYLNHFVDEMSHQPEGMPLIMQGLH